MDIKGSVFEGLARGSILFLFASSITWDNNNLITWLNSSLYNWEWLDFLAQNTLYLLLGLGILSVFIFRTGFVINTLKRIPILNRVFGL
jgi:hypothetical protein